jgi:quinol monooxygenase YgiN
MIRCTLRLVVSGVHRRQVVASLTPLIGWTRVEPGCRACNLLADLEEPRAIVLAEEWDTQDDLDRHLRSEDYRRVLEAIELSLRHRGDQRRVRGRRSRAHAPAGVNNSPRRSR